MNKPILSCTHLVKQFVESVSAVSVLTDVNLDVFPGEMVAIMGSSGSGKSTLLHLLAGLDNPTEGQAYIGEKNWLHLAEVERCRLRNTSLGFVYQFHHLLPEFTALENVMMPLLIRDIPVKTAQERAEHILVEVGLEQRLEHTPGQLSGGERQRVAIARALVGEPQCVLADEPTGNLDPTNAEKVLSLFIELQKNRKTSIILVTHDIEIAKQADRILRLQDGQLKNNHI